MRTRLVLLGAQTVALGLTVAFLMVPASALLLHAYGAHTLPYVYLVVAVSGVAVSWAMRRAQANLSLAALAMTILGGYGVLVAAGYAVLTFADADWVSFPLVVLFPLAIPVGFFLVGAQAGRLLDVRQMKEYFPRIVGGFSVGFAAGGLLAAWMVRLLPATADLLLVDLATTGAMIALVAATARRYPEQMWAGRPRRRRPSRAASRVGCRSADSCWRSSATRCSSRSSPSPRLHRLGARRRPVSERGRPGPLPGLVQRRPQHPGHRLRGAARRTAAQPLRREAGLAGTPAAAVVMLVVGNLVGWSVGVGGMAFLLVACAQQVGDVTDGMTRTAINTTYHAVPADQRMRARTLVEAAGVPLALGLVGVLLLVIRVSGSTSGPSSWSAC